MKNILLTLTFLSSLAIANDSSQDTKYDGFVKQRELAAAQKAESERLKIHAEFSFNDTKGNTDTSNYNLDTKLEKAFDGHELTFIGEAEYGSSSGSETNNKYFLEFNYGHKIEENLFLEYIAGYKYDKFSGYDYQAYTGPGLKYEALRSDIHNLDLSSALLLSQDKIQNDSSHRYTSFRAKVDYTWQILENLKFQETFTYRTDISELDDYFIYSKTALTSQLSDTFAVGLNYKIDYVSTPVFGAKRMDRALSASLIADF